MHFLTLSLVIVHYHGYFIACIKQQGKQITRELLTYDIHRQYIFLTPELITDRFKLSNMTVYNTRNRYTFYSWPVCTVLRDAEPLSHLEPTIREIVSNNMKNLSIFTAFKKAIK